jgi:Tfp pilus assembly protein PilP
MTRFLMLLLALIVLLPAAVAGQDTAPAAVAGPDAAPAAGTYNPENRRDPFISLLRRGVEAPATPVSRAAGITGQAAADLSLRGILASRGEFVGIVHGADNKTYIVRAGQKLADGTIRVIEKDSMVIVQHVNDPIADKPRELRKALRQDEAK